MSSTPRRDAPRVYSAVPTESLELSTLDIERASTESHELSTLGIERDNHSDSNTSLAAREPSPQSPAAGIAPWGSALDIKHYKLATAIWIIFAGLTGMSWYLSSRIHNPGFGTFIEGPCDSLKGVNAGSMGQNIIFAITIVSAFVTFAAGYFRTGLLAPSPSSYSELSEEGIYLGIDSSLALFHASWTRKLLYVVLFLGSLPVYFMSNSLVVIKYPAYNAYEILVSTSFFNGTPFNLSNITATRYIMNEARTMPPIDLKWPDDYGAVQNLTQSLANLQRDPALWSNLSRESCVDEFNKARYTKYRSLILVTSFVNTKRPDGDSVLAAGVLPGYRLVSAASSLVALCPDVYLEQYHRARPPPDTPFISMDASYGVPYPVEFLSPSEAEAWATNNTLARRLPGTTLVQTQEYDPMPSRELCYNYWTNTDRWEKKWLYRVPQCRLEYCLAEPMDPPLCQAVYNPAVLFILSIILSILLGAISFALLLRIVRDGIYSSEDVAKLYSSKGVLPCDRPDWPLSSRCDNLKWYHHRRVFYRQLLLNLVIFGYMWGLWFQARKANTDSVYPPDQSDTLWLIRAFAKYNAPHVIFEIQFFIETTRYKQRDFPNKDYDDILEIVPENAPAFGEKVKRFLGARWRLSKLIKSRKTRDMVWLPARSASMHFIYSVVFAIELTAVMPLEVAAGTFDGEQLVAFATFGAPAFNERSESRFWLYLLFVLVVFYLLPTLWIDFIFASGKREWESFRSTTTSAPVLAAALLTAVVGFVCGIVELRARFPG